MSEMVLLGPPPETLAILLDDPDAHDFPAVARIGAWEGGAGTPADS